MRPAPPPAAPLPLFDPTLSIEDRWEQGRSLRQVVPLEAHGTFIAPPERDPIESIQISNRGRVEALLPLRRQRMLASPFTFFRGNALGMAEDLASTPITGLQVQACGDAHLMNFGGFATPERNLIFDLNDFDETLPGPWEWDIKRLAASLVIAGQDLLLDPQQCRDAAATAALAYRTAIREHGRLDPMSSWSSRLDVDTVLDHAPSRDVHEHWQDMLRRARQRTPTQAVDRLTTRVDGSRRFREDPPISVRPEPDSGYFEAIQTLYAAACASLSDDVRFLLSRFRVVDAIPRVVGVGSVGTRCGVLLLVAGADHALVLQYKEARPSVLQPHVGAPPHAHDGQRVVQGQRLVQAASDLFLSWASDPEGRDYYFRQLRDMKTSIRLTGMNGAGLIRYGEICAATLARAHARSGDAAAIGGYLKLPTSVHPQTY